ncbi:MAG: Lytic transglycosylase catalytic, partial [Frankiales bacterium]|nr:Lytic transglycosylase catalytic [Frankiales bacterium]
HLKAIHGVVSSSVISTGAIRVGTRAINAMGVDPSSFRAFTPRTTATSNALWASIARDELGASYAARLPLGSTVHVFGRHATDARIGAVAAYDLPGSALVVDRAVARQVGLVTNTMLLAAPERSLSRLEDAVRDVVGQKVAFTELRPVKVTVNRRPATYRELYMLSATYCPGLSWKVLAAIGQVESDHGRDTSISSAGAMGPMQFLPSTWAEYGVDGDGDGKADILSAYDAVPAASLYLCRNGAGRGGQSLYDAIFNYNHADWYVKKVLALAAQYS